MLQEKIVADHILHLFPLFGNAFHYNREDVGAITNDCRTYRLEFLKKSQEAIKILGTHI